MIPKKCTKLTQNVTNGHIISQIAIKYIHIFQSKALNIFPKLGFLVWKQTIWQPCLRSQFSGQKKPLMTSWDLKLRKQCCQMVYFYTKTKTIWVYFWGPWNGECWYILWPFGKFFPRFRILYERKMWQPWKTRLCTWKIYARSHETAWQLCLIRGEELSRCGEASHWDLSHDVVISQTPRGELLKAKFAPIEKFAPTEKFAPSQQWCLAQLAPTLCIVVDSRLCKFLKIPSARAWSSG
jgi:hypothetical protein